MYVFVPIFSHQLYLKHITFQTLLLLFVRTFILNFLFICIIVLYLCSDKKNITFQQSVLLVKYIFTFVILTFKHCQNIKNFLTCDIILFFLVFVFDWLFCHQNKLINSNFYIYIFVKKLNNHIFNVIFQENYDNMVRNLVSNT